MEQRVHVAVEDGIAFVTMDDGKVNALSADLLRELGAAFDEAERAGAVVVLKGREGVFSAGFDLATFQRGAEATLEMLREGAALIDRILGFPRPVLTACAGHAYPAGAFLMLAADVRFGAKGPFRIGMNEVAIGLTVPFFALELARHRLTPPGFARITTAAMFAPDEALRLGYLDRIVAPEALEGEVREEALRLGTLHPASFTATKARIHGRAREAIRHAAAEELRAPAAA